MDRLGITRQGHRASPHPLSRLVFCLAACAVFFAAPVLAAPAEEAGEGAKDGKIEELDGAVRRLSVRLDEIARSKALDNTSWINRFTVGGYGEMHANFGEGNAPDQFDIHRVVAYVGYEFADWIRFHSETEIEHAFVSDGSGGEISIEQAYVDFLLSESVNVRFGRVLTPIGIINRKHEPPTFYGVERPSFDTVIVPTTWHSDGIGIFGALSPSLKYELYVVGGLDGSKFNALSGIRGGRIQERPSLHEPAATGRLDYYPFAQRPAVYGQTLRVGVCAYYGGLDNGNQGKNPGKGNDIRIASADFEYTAGRFDLRGAAAYERIDGAEIIGNGTASEIFGWYAEGAWRFWPASLRKGKLSRSDAGVFVRYDDLNTQYKMPAGVAKNPAGYRREWTAGVNFWLTPAFVAKADVQFRDDGTANDLDTLINFGIGWQF